MMGAMTEHKHTRKQNEGREVCPICDADWKKLTRNEDNGSVEVGEPAHADGEDES